MYAAMRFWLEKGVDGFRMDVLWLLIKDIYFQSNPPNPEYYDAQHDVKRMLPVFNADQPETLEIVGEMRALMAEYGPTIGDEGAGSSRVLIGEIYLPLDRLVRYYGAGPQLSGANLPFNFALIQTQWTAAAIAAVINTYEGLLPAGAWPNYVLGNHDQPRLATRIGKLQARAAAMLLLTLRGTPTMYYGDELGMVDAVIAPDQVRDPAEKNEPGKGRGRDPERSPMIWVNAANAGFTTPDAVPWLPLMAGWETENAAAQAADAKSMLMLYRKLLALRRQHDTLHAGGIADVVPDGAVLRYTARGVGGWREYGFSGGVESGE